MLKKMLKRFGIEVLRSEVLKELIENDIELRKTQVKFDLQNFLFNSTFSSQDIQRTLDEFSKSKSQLQQDLFALALSNFKTGGYFVEFGATDGISLSNTFMLENDFGWTGILAEPANKWHFSLEQNRSAIIDKKCLWKKSGEIVMFNETDIGELSTVDLLSSNDMHSENRKKGQKYEVETISLEDLLKIHNSPNYIDFLSIDTEGSEFEILNAFNFNNYKFGFICCEHNFTPNRELIFNLLTSNGYTRIFSEYSKFDDWYIYSNT